MVKLSTTLLALAGIAGFSADAVAPSNGSKRIIKSLLKDDAHLVERHEGRLRLYESGLSSRFTRKLASKDQQASCDASFLSCLPDVKCIDCFATLELEQIDWAGVTPDTTCEDVVTFLNRGGQCLSLEKDSKARGNFCETFNACVVWNNDEDEYADDDFAPEDQEGFVNCTALTECRWDGMKENWIGDGVCHDNMHGCYNTAICNYDGGDCCEDTCKDSESDFKTCGSDGFACRNPRSNNCNPRLTSRCQNIPDEKKKAAEVTCKDSEQKYRVIMYDSFGDGWDQTSLTIRDGSKKIFQGSLLDGSEGTEYICLSKEPTCYSADTSGGTWGVEVGWEIKTLKEGSPAIVGAGAPSRCEFPVAGDECEKTCQGKPTEDPTKDPDYKTFKELATCVEEKCIIQLGACKEDPVCERCFVEEAADFCYGVDSFNSVLDCTMCSCTDRANSEVCTKKDGPGAVVPPSDRKDNDNSAPEKCSAAETMSGAKAVMQFSKCSDMDDVGLLISEFDQSNFGQLDQFETCAHSFADEDNHGGRTALSCMQILRNAMTTPVKDGNNKNPPKEAIMALAKDIYENGEHFCDCTKESQDNCPLCPNFMSFKSLLYESLDACNALDQIDCDAWQEFSTPCQKHLTEEFGSTDMKMKDQCNFVKSGCGGAGAFPAFRRLDCASEINSDDWAFYRKYEKNCLNDGPPDDSPLPSPTLVPTSKAPVVTPTANKPTNEPYVPPDDDDYTPKPYVPSGSKGSSESKSNSHWFRNLILLGMLGGGGYYFYKTRYLGDQFNFMQYRRVRNFGNFGYGAEEDPAGMYSNLNSSTGFEPPSLPPTPQMMGGYEQGQQMQSFGN